MGDAEDVVGPWKMRQVGDWQAPLYMIPFDEAGSCTGPRTRQHLVEAVADPQVTHVVVLSHGWNSAWRGATELYDTFIDGLLRTRVDHPDGGAFRPVFVGIFWPSIVLNAPSERGPSIAGGGAGGTDDGTDDWPEQLRTVAHAVEPERRERFCELASRRGLDPDELDEFAAMLTPVWAARDGDDELAANPALDADGLVAIWQDVAKRFPGRASGAGSGGGSGSATPPPGPFAGPGRGQPGGTPAAAGVLDLLDPRNLVRVATVLLMKDRAGRVGASGVAALLGDVLAAGSARMHLVGHSYGGKVVLSAVCRMPAGARPVESVLLLQPAMSYLCFAANVPGRSGPGGYRPALGRSRQPVLSTYSSRDVPLGTLFHLAVRRDSDLGEAVIAAAPPSRYAALGGYGPAEDDPEAVVVEVSAPGAPYDRAAERRVLGVQASDVIDGHSAVNNVFTWWMLADQLRRAEGG